MVRKNEKCAGVVKNQCKLCLESVNNKTGIQCKGACKRWVHFECLSFTPGKIQDIKNGLIKIDCPCPACNTTAPKEELTNPPFMCENEKCPAVMPPHCKVPSCPSNPPCPGMPSDCEVPTCPSKPPCPNKAQTDSDKSTCPPKPAKTPCPAKSPDCDKPACPPEPPSPPTPPDCGRPTCPNKAPIPGFDVSENDSCQKEKSPTPKKKRCEVNRPKDKCPEKQKDPKDEEDCEKPSTPPSTASNEINKELLCAMQNLCNVMGELSEQVQNLMCKISEE